ncbi:hypothetical protein [uncultured Friedmanniella sp.]|uniref:hypothetical protein n=1 Tax=uncultured Friedmanniella sp. TaxID=335381 RepID=UPI0035CB82B9
MPDLRPEAGAETGAEALRQAAADAVTAVPHVVRLEPTLTSALRQLRTATRRGAPLSGRAAFSPVDGVDLTQRDGLVDIHVDITTATTQPADVTAQAVLDALLATVAARRLRPGDLTVTVLRLHR